MDINSSSDELIGMRLRMSRTKIGMSQKKLGDLLGISYQQIQKYEAGRNRLTGSRMVAVCNILQISLEWLVHGDEKDNKLLSDMKIDKYGFVLLRILSTLPDDRSKKYAIEILESFSNSYNHRYM